MDTMSRFIDIDSDIKLEPEPKGHKYGYYIFEQLSSITKNAICTINSIEDISSDQDVDIDLPITPPILQKEQNQDRFCKHIPNLLASKKLQPRDPYYLDNGILMHYIQDGNQTYEVTILPHCLTSEVLIVGHDELGHNRYTRTYIMTKGCIIGKGSKVMSTVTQKV